MPKPEVSLSAHVPMELAADPTLTGEWSSALAEIIASSGDPPWCLYGAREDGRDVGIGLFKRAPDEGNWVEIAYLTFTSDVGRGVASAIVRQLVHVARTHGASGIRAHTLPKPTSSSRVLEKAGFKFRGEVLDPDDGNVWRWELGL